MVGAYLADAMLQMIGVAAFFLPLVLGRLGLCWMRSRPAGSPMAKTIGLAMWVVFAPAAIALLPGRLLWRHALPIEGVTGRLLADFMVHYLNLPGASIVLALMVALSLYLATTFTFNTAREWATMRFGFVQRCGSGGSQPAQQRNAECRRSRQAKIWQQARAGGGEGSAGTRAGRRCRTKDAGAREHTLLGGLFGWLGRRKKRVEPLSVAPDEVAPCRRPHGSMWQAMPRTLVDAPPVTRSGHRGGGGSALRRGAGQGCGSGACASMMSRTSAIAASISSAGATCLSR